MLTLSLLAIPFATHAQPAKTMPRIGVILGGMRSQGPGGPGGSLGAFLQELRTLGYSEGQTIAFEYRWAVGQLERWQDLAAELVAFPVDVLVVFSGGAAQAAKHVTATLPIVVAASGSDLVATGLVVSMAHPGGNVTGLTLMTNTMHQKRLELLKEVVPGLSRVAVLASPGPGFVRQWEAFEEAAQRLGVGLHLLPARHLDDLDGAFVAAVQAEDQAIITAQQPFAARHRARIAVLAFKHRLPTMSGELEFADAGGLMTYGPNIAESWRRAASYVDKILKGAKPADLPVEQPKQFDLVLNLKTAKALGLAFPSHLLLLANKVIK